MDTKNWLERVEIKNKLHPTIRKTRKPLFVEHMSFRFHGRVFNLRCIYHEIKKEIMKFPNQFVNHIWEKPAYISWRSVSPSLARVKIAAARAELFFYILSV